MKLVGGDGGRVEHEQFVADVVLAPSGRVVVDVLFGQAGELTLAHPAPARVLPLATIEVHEEQAEPPRQEQFEILRTNADMVAERSGLPHISSRSPTRLSPSSPRWTWARPGTARSSTPARCIPRS